MMDYLALIGQLHSNIECAKYRGEMTAVLQIVVHGSSKEKKLLPILQAKEAKGVALFELQTNQFVMLIDRISQPQEAAILAQDIITTIPHNFKINIGIAVFPFAGMAAHELLNNSTIALKKGKDTRVNIFKFYKPEVHLSVERSIELEKDAQTVLYEKRLFLQYQPKMDILSNRITGAEALLRWQHPKFGLISPNDFIPILTNSDQIFDIGRWILEEAIMAFKRWGITQPFKISVNITPKQMGSYYLIEMITELLKKHKMNCNNLALELTESEMFEAIDINQQNLNALSEKNIQILIDDYGTGFSSLNYIDKLPINGVKLDKALMDDIAKNESSKVIVKSTIEMISKLGLRVIAEGIETQKQLDLLREYGCQEVQGFIISKPLDEDEFKAFYHSNVSCRL